MSKKRHEGVLMTPCHANEGQVHMIPADIFHEDDEACPIHACDEEVYTDPEYADEGKANTVGYGKKYAANYDTIDWGN